ncbi:MAG: AAA family ATPase [Candidatus Omnitrophica bacterium]|nr:AAA family ATPase [Candidatus Omnitrophota bacterium]
MAQYELNLRDYLRIFRKRKFIVIITTILCTIFGFYYSSRQIPVYEAYTTVKIEERKTVAGLLTELVTYSPGSTMESQAKIIKGFPILKTVAQKLNMINEQTPEEKVHQIVKDLEEKLTTETVGNTNILKITAVSVDPAEAMVLANIVAKVYVEENLFEKNKQARTVREFIENQLNALSQRMIDSEEKLKVFADKIKNIKVAEPIQQKLIDLEFELASLMQKYTEKHPKVIQLKDQISNLQNQIKGLSGDDLEYARLKREAEVDRKLYAMLKEKLEQARISEAEKIADVSIVDPAVMPRAPINGEGGISIIMGFFLGLVIGVILAFILEMSDTSIGTVEDVEAATKLPMLGVIPSVRGALFQEDESFLKRIKYMFLPRIITPEQENYIRLLVHHRPTSPFAEAFRNIRTNMRISSTNKVFLLTSSNPKEGKTAIICNLGLIISQENMKTLIVSSDLRRPQISQAFGIEREPGLTEVLQGSATLKDSLRNITDIMLGSIDLSDTLSPSGMRNIWILPSGSYPPNAAELLASKELPLVVEKLREEFDCILFDSPPVLPVTDPAIIAPLVDSVIICYEIGKTSKNALLRTKSQLEAVDANIIGLVLNHTKPETEPLEPYPYYRYRNRYYYREEAPKEGS